MQEESRGDESSETVPDHGGELDLGGAAAEDFGHETTGFLVVDSSRTVVGSSGINGRLTELVADRPKYPLTLLHREIADQVSKTVERAFETGDSVSHELDSDANERFLLRALPVEEMVVLQFSDITDSVQLLRELKRTRETLDTLEDGVYTLDEAFVITSVNDAVTEITGYSREELVGSHASKLAGDETLSMATEIIEQLRGSDVGLIESSIQTAAGESIPIETRFSTVEFANGDRRRVGVFRDIRQRRQHAHTLGALNRSARELLRADDEQTVRETIVGVANTVWPDATVVIYRFDKPHSRLVPAAARGVDPEPVGPETEEWTAFATGTPAASRPADESKPSPADTGPQPTGRVIQQEQDGSGDQNTLFASLEEYGLLTVRFDSAARNAVESVELLAANAVAAFGRVEREAELSRHRKELAEQNDQLERARQVNDLLRQINGALVEADSLSAIATAVCDHLAGADRISFAWFGESYRSGDELQPVALAGDGDGYLDGLDIVGTSPRQSESREPTLSVLESRSQTTVSDVSAGLHESDWRERALVRGFQSIVSVPVQYSDLQYGVLSVYANQPRAFDGILGELLDDLGETIGNAINSLETKRSLQSGSQVEVGLRIEDPDALVSRLAATLGEPITVDGVVPADADGSVLYLETEQDPSRLAESVLAVEAVRSLEDNDESRSAVTVTDQTVVDRLADYGADVEWLQADSDGMDLTAILPRTADVRRLIEALDEQYAAVELRTRADRPDSTENQQSFSASVSDVLTDRQQEALRAAYIGGYFEWPRASTGEEVAGSLGITQPTFNRHLRTTERKLFALLFDE